MIFVFLLWQVLLEALPKTLPFKHLVWFVGRVWYLQSCHIYHISYFSLPISAYSLNLSKEGHLTFSICLCVIFCTLQISPASQPELLFWRLHAASQTPREGFYCSTASQAPAPAGSEGGTSDVGEGTHLNMGGNYMIEVCGRGRKGSVGKWVRFAKGSIGNGGAIIDSSFCWPGQDY